MQYQLGLEAIGLLDAQKIKKILDIGCGDGRLTIQIGKNLAKAQVTGADISDDMLELAKQTAVIDAVKNITFIRQDAMKIGYKNEFDAIVSNFILNFIGNHKTFYQLLHDAIKPGGQLVVTGFHAVPSGKIMNMDVEAIQKILGRDEFREYAPKFWPAMECYSSPEKTRRLLEKAGFTAVDIQARDLVQHYPGLDAWYKTIYLMRWEFALKAFPEEKKQEFVDAEKACLEEQLASMDDAERQEVLETTFPAAIITAIKP
jgi:trans-aconitate 2-methyltransferase